MEVERTVAQIERKVMAAVAAESIVHSRPFALLTALRGMLPMLPCTVSGLSSGLGKILLKCI